MEQILFCPCCDAYHYVRLMYTLTSYFENEENMITQKFQCLHCETWNTETVRIFKKPKEEEKKPPS